MRLPRLIAFGTLAFSAPAAAQDLSDLYRFQSGQETRWASPENPTAAKGAGAQENRGAKGHAFETIRVGASHVLADIKARERSTGCG